MLSPRADSILKSIVKRYIAKATPVPSQYITDECGLRVSPATVRNEMAYLEQEGYIARPHPSAGSVPSDKGYRYYVDSIRDVKLPLAEQRLINHLFHQVERELEEWLSLAAMLTARSVQNVAVVTTLKAAESQFKYLELVSLQDFLGLIILVLRGARVRRQLVNFDQIISQPTLAAVANKLNSAYSGLGRSQILAKEIKLSPIEQQIIDCLLKIMEAEDEREYEEPHFDGWHFMLSQPEFAQGQRMATLMELVEQKSLLKVIIPPGVTSQKVQIVIGKENKADIIHDYSVVISQYGLPVEAVGTIGIVGPRRMPYARAISIVSHLSAVLSELTAELYGRKSEEQIRDNDTAARAPGGKIGGG